MFYWLMPPNVYIKFNSLMYQKIKILPKSELLKKTSLRISSYFVKSNIKFSYSEYESTPNQGEVIF
jgi:hypothetical protein